tara:strand:+ start:79 stop:576 length:498 start_codon:yes stop_codon:yes gene_type:complete
MELYEKHLNHPNLQRLIGTNKGLTINILNYLIYKEINNLFEIIKNYLYRINYKNVEKMIDKFMGNYNSTKLSIENKEDLYLIKCITKDNYNNLIISFIDILNENDKLTNKLLIKYSLYNNILYDDFIFNIINKYRNDEIDSIIKMLNNKHNYDLETIKFLYNLKI